MLRRWGVMPMRLDYYGWPPKRLAVDNWSAPTIEASVPLDEDEEAGAYIPHPDLISAVNVALVLGKPLLVTGEPGTGKTRLANSIAWQLGLNGPFKFVSKSTSQARDLFYSYDALGRFYALEVAKSGADTSGGRDGGNPLAFIEYAALGKAILLAHPRDTVAGFLPHSDHAASNALQHPGMPSRSVVVVDEIDKAPRDFPNDLLDELDHMRFRVPELQDTPTPEIKDRRLRPVIIITSNQERQLPEAFLRRCLYFQIPFPPSRSEQDAPKDGYFIEDIVAKRMGTLGSSFVSGSLAREAVEFFFFLRNLSEPLAKRPATAELIDWLDALRMTGADPNLSLRQQPAHGRQALFTLLKGSEDASRGNRYFEEWCEVSGNSAAR